MEVHTRELTSRKRVSYEGPSTDQGKILEKIVDDAASNDAKIEHIEWDGGLDRDIYVEVIYEKRGSFRNDQTLEGR